MNDASIKDTDGEPRASCAVIIPVYDHPLRIAAVIQAAMKLNMPVFVVDDGSADETAGLLEQMSGIRLIRHPENRGKGAALITGMTAAAAESAKWAITLDADGQHDPMNAPGLLGAVADGKRTIVVGKRCGMNRARAPWTSRFGRRFSNFWVRMAGGPRMADSQSGFRLYPIRETLDLNVRSRRFQFEIEVLVKAAWKGIPIVETPVSVSYSPGGKRVSHFHPFFDFMRNFGTFARLITRRVFGLI